MRKETGRSDEKISRKICEQPNKIASKMIVTQKLTHTNFHVVFFSSSLCPKEREK